MAELPEYMTEMGYSAGRLDPDAIVAAANHVGQQLGIDEVVRYFFRPYLYLDNQKIAAAKLDRAELELSIARALTNLEGINLAVSSLSLETQTGGPLHEQVRRNHHGSRSGDIYVIQDPYWFLFDEGPITGMHGSPWRYDNHVPIIFAGAGIPATMVSRLVHPVDVAPTLSALLGISGPAASQGQTLVETLQ